MSSDLEKQHSRNLTPVTSVRAEEVRGHDLTTTGIPEAEEKKLLRKLDWHIAPVLCALYLLSFLDRSNIGNAAVAGLTTDLHLPTNGLNVATSIFYVTYVTFELPSAAFLKRFRPSRMIPAIIISWGLVILFSGFMSTYGGLIATRLILGCCEAALFPCMSLYLTMFYRRHELARRTAFLFIAAALSGAFGGLLAAAILKMDGIGGRRGWQWLYILEGLVSVLYGISVIWLLSDSPEKAWYLNDRDREMMKIRQEQDSAYVGDSEMSWAESKRAIKDLKVYLSGFCQLGVDTCLFGFSTFLPVIIQAQSSSYTTIHIQLLTVPVYAWAALIYISLAMLSDRINMRAAIMIPCAGVSIIGYIILLTVHHNPGVEYFATFLVGTGIYLCVGLNVTWLNQNQAGHHKRATAIGLQQFMGNCGGVIAGQIYVSSGSPYYTVGHAVSLAGMCWAACGFVTMYLTLQHLNNRKDRLTKEQREEADSQAVKGDAHYLFRFCY
ncbi:high-affinity nicotinic acid transporter [Calocera cornea HHB12733]|uniref:High-affinity nicotinic acid transporter n=1 Tax=Calocera cornea HHB12733 TaxID=1353952 RepID=A0A165I6M1_9BASI|nr:high-affinity nicotinic acid transporter [Calocera cornea HHB12733]